ncbi:MAG: triose-phosphate isomerase [Planctomycetota bacterium]
MASSDGFVLAQQLLQGLPATPCDVVVFPTFLAASAVAGVLRDSPIAVGVQDISPFGWGAFTGEIGPAAVLAEGIRWCLVGHSERRTLIGETDELLASKAKFALDAGLNVIFCIGETLGEREGGLTYSVLERQLSQGLLKASPDLSPSLVVAYEPVWAIGTGRTATPEIAQQTHEFIRSYLASEVSREAAERTRILYGGSVKSSNIKALMACPDIDGALVGGASLNSEEFLKILSFKE